MAAPVNVVIPLPTIPIDGWPELAQEWSDLNRQANGHPEFYPLTIKAAYVIGVIHDLCMSVGCLMRTPGIPWQITYLAAYGVFASSLDVLGRCIRGNSGYSGSGEDIRTGFKWLVSSAYDTVPNNHDFIDIPRFAVT
jgi:hypothetical protein